MHELIKKLENLGLAYRDADYGISSEAWSNIDDRVMRALREVPDEHISIGAKTFRALFAFRGLSAIIPAPVRFVLRPVGVLAGIFVVVFMGFTAMAAFSSSLPGDALYGMKLASERAYVSLTLNPQTKTQLELELAGRRLEEVAMLAESTLPDREERLALAVDHFKTQLNSTQTKLQNLSTSRQTTQTAKIVDRKATEYGAVLNQAGTQVSGDAQAKVAEARDATQEASFAAVTILLEGQETGEVSLEEVRTRVGDKLRELEASIQLIALRLITIPSTTYPEIEAVGGPTLGSLLVDISLAREVLEDGKNVFAQGGFEAALASYRDGVGLVNQLEWGVGLYEQALRDRENPAPVLESTGDAQETQEKETVIVTE